MAEKKKLAMFDMDGTLYDTIEINYYAYREAIAHFGVDLDRDFFMNECFGHNYKTFVPMIMGDSEHAEEIHELKMADYKKYFDKAKMNSHLFNMIENLRKDYYIALVTTGSKKNVYEIVRHFGHEDLFDLIVTQADVAAQKPDPEAYLFAMNHFGVEPEDCLIFEDSRSGLTAAKKSGAQVFKVENFID